MVHWPGASQPKDQQQQGSTSAPATQSLVLLSAQHLAPIHLLSLCCDPGADRGTRAFSARQPPLNQHDKGRTFRSCAGRIMTAKVASPCVCETNMLLISNSIPLQTRLSSGRCSRSRRALQISCNQQAPRSRGAPVVMRDLPLPGQPDSLPSPKSGITVQQTAQQTDNGVNSQSQYQGRYVRDEARQASNSQASTSSYTQQQPAAGNRYASNGSNTGLNTLEASTAMEQAAPGFKSAARQAAVSSNQLAQGMLDADQGLLFSPV